MNTVTLFEALSAIPDHRTKKGRRYPLAAIVTISLAAMLAGANDLRAIFRWGRRLSPKALLALGVDKKRKKAPCHATYHYVFQSISAEELRAALGTLVKVDGPLGHVAFDGKRLRGSQHETSPGVHMLNAFSTKLQAAVGALVVPPDSGECVEALELIKTLPLQGAVISAAEQALPRRIGQTGPPLARQGDQARQPEGAVRGEDVRDVMVGLVPTIHVLVSALKCAGPRCGESSNPHEPLQAPMARFLKRVAFDLRGCSVIA